MRKELEAVPQDKKGERIAELRRAFNDDARDPHVIETISKRGYRLLAPVSRPERPAAAETGATTTVVSDSIVVLVFREATRAYCGIHLDSRHAAASADGSTYEFRVEIHAADGAHQHYCDRYLEFYATGLGAMVRERGSGAWFLRFARPMPDGRQEN